MEKTHAEMERGAEEGRRRSERGVGAQLTLRVMAFIFAFSSIFTMLSSSQSLTLFGTHFSARYYYSFSFRFLVGVDVAASICALLSTILIILNRRNKERKTIHASRECFFLFLHDMVVMLFLLSGNSAAAAIGYVGKYGQEQTGWMPICENAHSFCSKVFVSITLSFLSFLCFFFLSLANATTAIGCTAGSAAD